MEIKKFFSPHVFSYDNVGLIVKPESHKSIYSDYVCLIY